MSTYCCRASSSERTSGSKAASFPSYSSLGASPAGGSPEPGGGRDRSRALALGDPFEQGEGLVELLLGHEQLGQGDDRVLVAGIELDRLAQALFVACTDQCGQRRLRFGREQRLDEPFDVAFGKRADEPVDDPSVAQGVDGRDRLDLECAEICGFSSTLTLARTT